MKSPFIGKLDLNEMHVYMQKDRQESFENRIIELIFRVGGISAPKLRMLMKRANAGTNVTKYAMDWFNNFSYFPVKLSARRFHSKRKFVEFFRVLRLGMRFMETPEVLALLDLKDAYPGEEVAFISRYPDCSMDLVFHTLDGQVKENSFLFQRRQDDVVYRVEQLSPFLRELTEAWNLQHVFEGS